MKMISNARDIFKTLEVTEGEENQNGAEPTREKVNIYLHILYFVYYLLYGDSL